MGMKNRMEIRYRVNCAILTIPREFGDVKKFPRDALHRDEIAILRREIRTTLDIAPNGPRAY